MSVLRSDWLTQGPSIPAFERALAEKLGASNAVACSSGTAALHLAMLALDLGPGDEIVTTPITFLATANCARFVGAEVRFVDVDAETGLMSVEALQAVLEDDIERNIKAVLPVHFAGQPADLPAIYELAMEYEITVVDDACHAIGSWYKDEDNRKFITGGSPHADMTVFSFHPVKHIAMGEGGAITTRVPELASRLKLYRNHGMRKDNLLRCDLALDSEGVLNPWYYEMHELGFNYRLTDIQAALGKSQLTQLDNSLEKRNKLAELYRESIAEAFPDGSVRPLAVRPKVYHAYHLFVIQIEFDKFGVERSEVMKRFRAAGIGTQVHYIPIHLQPYYANRYNLKPGDFPQSEQYYSRALSLPMYPGLTESDIFRVVEQLEQILKHNKVSV